MNFPLLIELASKQEEKQLSELPPATVEHLKRLITKAAQTKRGPNDDDIPDEWTNAMELTHWAFNTSKVERPAPYMKEAWKQYVDILQHAVKMLAHYRGLDGDWRLSASDYNVGSEYS